MVHFAEWDVLYCSVPTSPGGGYRSTLGRLVFKTKEMIQVIEAPDIVKNKVSFSAFGFLDGEVSLTGRLLVSILRMILIFEVCSLITIVIFQCDGYNIMAKLLNTLLKSRNRMAALCQISHPCRLITSLIF